MTVDEPNMQVTNMGEGSVGSPAGSLQTQPPVKNAEGSDKCTEGLKYISTMTSIEDSYFKETVLKELLKDKKVTYKAFSELSPASV